MERYRAIISSGRTAPSHALMSIRSSGSPVLPTEDYFDGFCLPANRLARLQLLAAEPAKGESGKSPQWGRILHRAL